MTSTAASLRNAIHAHEPSRGKRYDGPLKLLPKCAMTLGNRVKRVKYYSLVFEILGTPT